MSDVSENPLFLPEELICNILLRLPVKAVLVCTSVCKAWNSFIKSPSFVSSHLNRTISSYKDNETRLYLLQLGSRSPTQETAAYSFSLRSDDEKLSEYSSLHFPYKHEAGFQVISSCNGLVLLKTGDAFGRRVYNVGLNLILWNPVLRKSVIIVKEKKIEKFLAAGLGLDSRGDYKVLTIIIEKWGGDLKLDLYSLKTNSWTRLIHFEGLPRWFPTFNMEMIFLNGVFHLITFRPSRSRSLILGFNLDAETLHEIELPECMRTEEIVTSKLTLWACGEALSVVWIKVTGGLFQRQLWVMEKYGVPESWIHLSTVSSEVNAYKFMLRGLVYRNDVNVLLSYFRSRSIPSMMVSLDLKSQETFLGFFLGNYVESLVLMDKGDDLSLVFETDPCSSNDASFSSSSDNAKGASSSWMKKVVNYVFGILCVKSSDEVSSESGQDLGETSSGAAIQNDNQVDANEDSTDAASLEA